MPDWVFITLGWLLTAVALALLGWSLVGDRPRGRKRCPKCWYDLSGHVAQQPAPPWTCPECGRSITTARAITRARRRRWLIALLALAAMTSVYLTPRIPAIRARGWWAAVPRPVLLAMMYDQPVLSTSSQISQSYSSNWYNELSFRYRQEPVGWWPAEATVAKALVNRYLPATSPQRYALGAIAAEALSLTSNNPLDGLSPQVQAIVAVIGMQARYARAERYESVGMSASSWGPYLKRPPIEAVFYTALERTHRRVYFDSRYLHSLPPHSFDHAVVAWGGDAMYQTATDQRTPSGIMDLPSVTAILEADKHSARWFFRQQIFPFSAETCRFERAEQFDGHLCIRVADVEGPNTWALIDAHSLVLRKYSYHGIFTAVLRPTLNGDTAPPLAYDNANDQPRPIGDGSALMIELRDLLDAPPSDPEPQ